ncbi:MAG: T9SS type A sorting domain-containing protein [Bacteroidota bacterium]
MKNITKTLFVTASLLVLYLNLNAQRCQDIPELNFSSPYWVSYNQYRFPSVLPGVDAKVSIVGSHNASLASIDLTHTGELMAFQPQVNMLNQYYHGGEAYMDFQIDFVYSNTHTPYVVNSWAVTAADVDGDDYKLRESVGFGGFNSYTTETNSALELSDNSTSSLTIFDASSTFNLPGITTNNTQHMVYVQFGGTSSFQIRAGIIDEGGPGYSYAYDRMFAFYFDPCLIEDFIVPNTLPVEFSYFDVRKEEGGVSLQWETAFELNNDRFEIEKSVNGQDFEKLGEVMGVGNSQESNSYNFFDPSPKEGKNYYRLKQVDFDGQFMYSELKELTFSYDQTDFYYSAYPNPSTDILNIVSPNEQEAMKVRLFDQQGHEIKSQALINGKTVMNVSQLAKGMYFLSLESESFRSKGKTIIIN